jgi:S1-C subfamily serine protease
MRLVLINVILFIIAVTGCSAPPPEQKPDASKILTSLQEEINKAVKGIEPSLVYAELSGARSVSSMTGMVISSDGKILLPTYLSRIGVTERVQVYLQEKEYEASLVQADDRLKISIVKIQTESSLSAVNLGNAYLTQPGQFVIGVVNGGKNNDFRTFVDVGFIRGMSDDAEFDQVYSLGLTVNPGAVMLTLDGKVIAAQLKGSGTSDYARTKPEGWIISNEIQKCLSKLLAKSSSEKEKVSEEEKQKVRPWLGFGWSPINEDYAEMTGFPKKSILVRYVIKNSPIEKDGLRPDDLILEVDNKPLTKIGSKALEQQFIKYIDPEVDREIIFKVLRPPEADKFETIKSRFIKKPETREFRAEDIGVVVQEITDTTLYERNLLIINGVLVNNVIQGSPASASSSGHNSMINRDDVIVEINRMAISNIDDFIKAIEAIRREKPAVILLKLAIGSRTSFVAINLKAGKK